jgi:hypothetical protein
MAQELIANMLGVRREGLIEGRLSCGGVDHLGQPNILARTRLPLAFVIAKG